MVRRTIPPYGIDSESTLTLWLIAQSGDVVFRICICEITTFIRGEGRFAISPLKTRYSPIPHHTSNGQTSGPSPVLRIPQI